MFQLKPISREAIPSALSRADRYRLLNQPRQAQSICLDILNVDPSNQPALVMLLLSVTEEFGRPGREVGINDARAILPRLEGEYERTYYEGVTCERWGKSLLAGRLPAYVAIDWLGQAMTLFEKAERLSPPASDDPILRWNACARLITSLEESGRARSEESEETAFGNDTPPE